jgi:uncharacterized protein YegP (UPF0339 family)
MTTVSPKLAELLDAVRLAYEETQALTRAADAAHNAATIAQTEAIAAKTAAAKATERLRRAQEALLLEATTVA